MIAKMNALGALIAVIGSQFVLYKFGVNDPKYVIGAEVLLVVAIYSLNKMKDPTAIDFDVDDMKFSAKSKSSRVTKVKQETIVKEGTTDVGQIEKS